MGALFMGNKPLVHVDHRRVPPALPEALLQACFTPPLKTSRCRFGGMRAQVWVGCKVP